MGIISASVLACDFTLLKEQIREVEKAGVEWLHYDVMDGHFVPNISFGSSILNDIDKITNLFLDVHLMISNPLSYYQSFVDAGADLITIHYEAFNQESDLKEAIKQIKKSEVKVGLSINPKTPYEVLIPFLKDLDLVLIMSVEPGFGGQVFDTTVIDKIKSLKAIVEENEYNLLLEIDGGINSENSEVVRKAGIDIIVAGSYIFNSKNILKAVELLK